MEEKQISKKYIYLSVVAKSGWFIFIFNEPIILFKPSKYEENILYFINMREEQNSELG